MSFKNKNKNNKNESKVQKNNEDDVSAVEDGAALGSSENIMGLTL